jgi:hypothetical protein
MRKMLMVGVTMLVLVPASGERAKACMHYIQEHILDSQEQALDSDPPGKVEVLSAEIVGRGQGPVLNGGSWGSTSTDDLGVLKLQFVPPADDRTGPDKMGYRIEHLDGEMPPNLLPDFDVRALEGVVWLYWADGATDYQEPIDFRFTVRAVDLAGNLGEVSQPIEVYHPGSAGCSTGGIGQLSLVACILALLVLRRGRHF